jgi:hypothetical protein
MGRRACRQRRLEESIVETPTYLLVRKTGDAGAVAEELDPRASPFAAALKISPIIPVPPP